MKVRELIQRLLEYNPDADISTSFSERYYLRIYLH